MGIVTENNLNCKVRSCFLGKHTWALSTEGLTLHWKCVTPYQELSHLPCESFTTFWNSSVSVFPQDNTNSHHIYSTETVSALSLRLQQRSFDWLWILSTKQFYGNESHQWFHLAKQSFSQINVNPKSQFLPSTYRFICFSINNSTVL